MLVFNSISTKLLFRHGPSVGGACRGWLLPGTEAALQPQHPLKALPGFQPSSSETKQAEKVKKRGER